jgi:transcription-repair coupling factor (superfamily II helicase)
VGFDLYCQLVTEAVAELEGLAPEPAAEVTIEIPVAAHLPVGYVARDDVRMEAYRRLAAVTEPADVADLRAEWEDRYGPLPEPAEALLAIARLRVECVRLGVRSVTLAQRAVRIRGLALKASQTVRLQRLAPGAKVGAEEVMLPWPGAPDRAAAELADALEALVPRETAEATGSG